MKVLITFLFSLGFFFSVSAAVEQAPSETPAVSNYLLSPFDKLQVSVYGQEDLDSLQLISDVGQVSIPLVGELTLGGLTVSKAQKLIERSFIEQRYLVKPVVTIHIQEFSPKIVTVVGEVDRPGSVEIPPGMNGLPIQIAIAEAGGFSGAAQKGEVKVTRGSADKQSATRKETFLVDVGALLSAKSESESGSFRVLPNDIIFVPRRLF